MQIAIPLFKDITFLDAIGPYEVLRALPDTQVVFVAQSKGLVRSDNADMAVMADATFDEIDRPDVIVVPGGYGSRAIVSAPQHDLVDWVASVHPTTTFTTSVCTGSLVLAKAGLLNGKSATTHWGAYGLLEELGAKPTGTRVVEHLQDRIITAAGVSSGIDMALRLAELLHDDVTAKATQLAIEYDPQPPFDAGSVDKAGAVVMNRLVQLRQAATDR